MRYLLPYIQDDLLEKMVFIGGPRQVGKTTLGLSIGENYKQYTYLNWDDLSDKKKIIDQRFNAESQLIFFDEIHKYPHWKNYLKGLYDKQHQNFSLLVTGSARLDMYKKGGDSLMGRYHYYRLHPFSLAELLSIPHKQEMLELEFSSHTDAKNKLNTLFDKGGFPEPCLSKQNKTLRRWQNQRTERLVSEDIRDTENIRMLSLLELLTQLLPERVGSTLSLNSLREDLQVNHQTIQHWMNILEIFYFLYRLQPYQHQQIKSLRKDSKMYLWDWSVLTETGAKFENMIASHLLKYAHFLYDAHGYKVKLHYLRDKSQREVDFLLTLDGEPWLAVEVKYKDTKPSKNLLYFKKQLNIPLCFQVVYTSGIDEIEKEVRIISADKFLTAFV